MSNHARTPIGGALAIVLARAGSKGVPGKNTRDVAGRPCVAWTIDAARAARGVHRVVVSSDDPRVLTIAAAMGAMTHARPPALATDSARVDDAARDALAWAERDLRDAPAPIVILYGNVPVRPADLIDRALALLIDTRCDSVQSYTSVGKVHPWWLTRLDAHGRVKPWDGDVLNHGVFRRQDLPPAFVPDGGVIALTRAALRLELPGMGDADRPGPHAFLGLDRRGVQTAEGEVIDIDTELDLIVADAVLRRRAADAERSSRDDQAVSAALGRVG